MDHPTNQPWKYFRDEDELTEAQWRAEAPADRIAQLDRDQAQYPPPRT